MRYSIKYGTDGGSDMSYQIEKNASFVTVRAEDDFTVTFSCFGASVARLQVPVAGMLRDVLLGFQNPEDYQGNDLYAGATLAPTAGRIQDGRLPVGQTVHQLSQNENGRTSLHGGFHNASFRLWKLESAQQYGADSSENRSEGTACAWSGTGSRAESCAESCVKVIFSITLPDQLDGFPGNRDMKVCYTVGSAHELRIDYSVRSDRDTYVNLSNHSYFNLAEKEGAHWGAGDSSPAQHLLQINADRVIYTDGEFFPTDAVSVQGTLFDFRTAVRPEQYLSACKNESASAEKEQLRIGKGYNHAWILSQEQRDTDTVPAVILTAPTGDLSVRMYTDSPCVVFYSAGYADDSHVLCDGRKSAAGCAYAFEMEDYPDAPNHPDKFPYRILKAGQTWKRTVKWEFVH